MSNYEISKSSLLSLKAEILRKQDEAIKTKINNNIKIAQHIKKNKPLDIKNKGIEKRIINDTVEDEDLLKKSKAALEAKSKLYDKLSKDTSYDEDEELNKKYLVHFKKKAKDQRKNAYSSSESEDEPINEANYEPASNPDDEWVEYTDCLGRTRKCLRKDLEHIKLNDAELKSRVESKEDKVEKEDNIPKETVEVSDNNYDETSELLSSDMRRELLRKQWEIEEDELRNKSDVHYQDILFNEARTHGVGYYQFSKDEEVRKVQQDALKNLRKETQEQQKRAQELKQLREKQLKTRIKAAKNRKRARMGLPPEEESDTEETNIEEPQTPVVEITQDDEERETARKNHIRPWDIGKKGVKEHYVHTQAEWVEKKRKDRPTEFAPPTEYKKYVDKEDKKSLYFTTKKKRRFSEEHQESINPYKSRSSEFTKTSIINELEVSDDDDRDDYAILKGKETSANKRGRGVEIAPPASLEYNNSKLRKSKGNNIEDSIDAGLKFLRMQTEKKASKMHPSDIFLE